MLKIDRLSEEQSLRKILTCTKLILQKDRKRKSLKLANAKAKMSNAEREEFLLKERMRMRKLLAAKKSAQHDEVGNSSNSMPYQSSQSLGKAVK